jgi:hypothetical protein
MRVEQTLRCAPSSSQVALLLDAHAIDCRRASCSHVILRGCSTRAQQSWCIADNHVNTDLRDVSLFCSQLCTFRSHWPDGRRGKRVCVVGAGGASGAAACSALSHAGHVVVPLDGGVQPGGVWTTLPPKFLTDTKRSQMRLCGNALGSSDNAEEYPLAEEVLTHVCKASCSSTLFRHRVTLVERLSAGKWRVAGVHTETAAEFCIIVDAVVVATGACSVPFYPPCARACFDQQQMQRHRSQQDQKPVMDHQPRRRLRSQGMSIVHSHYFPWNNAQEFAGQVKI